MQHDDYDPNAFQELLPVLTAHQARVMNRSILGDIMMIHLPLQVGLLILQHYFGRQVWESSTC